MVTDLGDSPIRVLRDNIVIHTGKMESLRRFKNDVSEVKAGFECGIDLVNFSGVKQGDESSEQRPSGALPTSKRRLQAKIAQC